MNLLTKFSSKNYSYNPIAFKGSFSTEQTKTQTNTSDKVLNVSGWSENDIVAILMNSQTDYTKKDPKTRNCLVHELVKKNYFSALRFITLNPTVTKTFINLQGENDKTPLDLAVTPKMINFLKAKGALHSSELTEEDAKTVSAKLTVEKKIQVEQPNFSNLFAEQTGETPVSEEKALCKSDETFKQKPTETKNEKNIAQRKTIAAYDKWTRLSANTPDGLDDVVGYPELKTELKRSVIMPLKTFDSTTAPNGVLFSSTFGNGSSFWTSAISADTNLPVLELTEPQRLAEMMKDMEQNFKQYNYPTILFIRGIDGFANKTDFTNNKEAVNNFVRNLTNCAKRGVFVIATSNEKDKINKAILAPTILSKTFNIDLPDEKTRYEFLEKSFAKNEYFSDINNTKDIQTVVNTTSGFSMSQLKHVVNESIRTAVTKNCEKITVNVLLGEISRYSKEQDLPEINEYNKTSMYDTKFKREKIYKNEPKSLNEVGGMFSVKEKLMEKIIEPYLHKDELIEQGVGMPDGIVLHGPSGTGKTYIVKAVGRHLGLPVYVLKLSDIGTSFVHETAKAIRDFKNQLTYKFEKTGEMSIVLMDELDSIGGKKGERGSNTEEVNTLLQEFNNPGDSGIILIGATNDLDNVEGALLRDGRMGELVYVGYADFESRKDLIKTLLSTKEITREIARDEAIIDNLAKKFDEMSSASIVKVIREAITNMIIKNEKFNSSVEKSLDKYNEKEVNSKLAKEGFTNNKSIKIDKNSTIKYDTTYNRAFLSDEEPPNFTELAGMEPVKNQLRKNIINLWSLESRKLFKENNISLPGGAILYGPSANGKTTIARALAGEMNIPLYELSMSDVGDSYIHETTKKMAKMFEQLAYKYSKTGEPSILFIDELEKFAPKRDSLSVLGGSHKSEEITELLRLMNNASANGIILLGATNYIDQIDDAIKGNPRRMGMQVFVDVPDEAARLEIIKKSLQNKPVAKTMNNDNDIKALSDMFAGKTIGKITDILKKEIIDSIINKNDLTVEKIKLSLGNN